MTAGPPGSATIARVLADQLVKSGVTSPEFIEFVGDDEYPFIEAGIPVGGAENGGAENGDADGKKRKQVKAWGGQAGEPYDRCYHEACDTIDNVSRRPVGCSRSVHWHLGLVCHAAKTSPLWEIWKL